MSQTKVLLVEDEEMIGEMVAEALIDSGFDVQSVTSANEALRYIESGEPVDVLFTDINFPSGIDGAQLGKRARALRPEMPIVYTSGLRTAADLAPLPPRSMFVPKPYEPSQVCKLLSHLTASVR